jgi:hypothetical protein
MKDRRPKRTLSVGIVIAATVALAGCTPSVRLPEPWEYMCSWSNGDYGSFELGTDATGEVAVLADLLAESISSSDLVSGQTFSSSATWLVGDGVTYRSTDGAPALTIVISTSDGPRFWRLRVSEEGGSVVLDSPTPDPDNFDYVRFTSANCFDPGY